MVPSGRCLSKFGHVLSSWSPRDFTPSAAGLYPVITSLDTCQSLRHQVQVTISCTGTLDVYPVMPSLHVIVSRLLITSEKPAPTLKLNAWRVLVQRQHWPSLAACPTVPDGLSVNYFNCW